MKAMESTPDKIAHGRAMLNTIASHTKEYRAHLFDLYGPLMAHDAAAIDTLRRMYDFIEERHRNGLIRDPHPRQVGDRILPQWEWWLHRFLVWAKLGRVEE